MASIPTPIRATLGLLATALDAVQELVDHAPEIPMEAVGNSMQLSLRLQQHYVALLTRGDEFLASLRGAPEEPPAWATFDEPPPSGPNADSSSGADPLTEDGLTTDGLTVDGLIAEDELSTDDDPWADAVDDLPEAEIQDGPRHAGQGDPLLAAATRGRPVAAPAPRPAKKATSAEAPAKKAPARKAPAEKAAKKSPAVKAAAKKAPAKKAAAKIAPAKTIPAKKAPAKRAVGAKTIPAKKVPSVKATSTRRAKDPAASAAPVLDLAGPIPTPGAPAKRGRPAEKAGALKATAAPQLDASLTVDAPSARPQSAFDLTDPSTSASTTGVGLPALAGTGATDDGVGPSAPQIH
jgi:hypothetical protein